MSTVHQDARSDRKDDSTRQDDLVDATTGKVGRKAIESQVVAVLWSSFEEVIALRFQRPFLNTPCLFRTRIGEGAPTTDTTLEVLV